MKYLLIFFFIKSSFVIASTFEQDAQFIVDTISKNYSGYQTKVDAIGKDKFKEITNDFIENADQVSVENRLSYLKTFLSNFKDGHLDIRSTGGRDEQNKVSSDGVELYKGTIKESSQFKEQQSSDPIVGLWKLTGSDNEISIVKAYKSEEFQYRGFLTRDLDDIWKKGAIKLSVTGVSNNTYEVIWQNKNLSKTKHSLKLDKNGQFLLSSGLNLEKKHHGLAQPLDPDLVVPQWRFFLKKISDDTLLLRIPHFGHYEKLNFDQLLLENHELLTSTPNLIIDMRESWGGADFVYKELLKYIYTRPIYSVSVEVLATEENASQLRNTLQEDIPIDVRHELEAKLKLLEANYGGFVQLSKKGFYIKQYDEVYRLPKKVGILINNAKSTGEQFILGARQSYKTRLYGKPSAGILDFSNTHNIQTPSGQFELQYPVSRSLRLPDIAIDKEGIQPDFPIKEDVIDPVTFVRKCLENDALDCF